jgi:uncharacterized protein (TIGR02466 family)
MEVQSIFASFIAVEKLQLDNDKLEKFCLENAFGKEVNSGYVNLDELELQELLEVVSLRINALHDAIGLSSEYKQEIMRLWITCNDGPAITEPHCHPKSFFSAVYYPRTGNKETYARLNFLSPVRELASYVDNDYIDKHNQFLASTWAVNPQEGMLLIFPSWLWHYVDRQHKSPEERFMSGSTRISIAFDTKIIKKD